MMSAFLFAAIGLTAGVFSGLLGIGGATIMVPMLVYFWGFSQHLAQGTTLAVMVLPIGLLAAYKYYVSGNVDMSVVLYLAAGFFVGGLLGAVIAQPISDQILRKLFGGFLLIIALRMIIF
jgi:uncharacterized membrane protein YfcA